MSIVARTTTKLISPFLVTYAAYLILYSSVSPGGGFQAGVILGVAIILLITSHGYKRVRKRFKKKLVSGLEGFSGVIISLILGIAIILTPLPSESITLPFNIFVGIKVGSAFTLIFYSLTAFMERD
ncbi:putative monovalent cation/H+ antiporter subunit B [Pyrococcus sp. ST04]|nr:putative monovalent cation/H+ antiporter subunit B [Pyrococcus sp. ST04]